MAIESTPTTASAAARRAGLQRVIAVLRRRWWILIFSIVLVGGVAFARAATQPKQYSATAALQFQNSGLSQAFFGSPATLPSNDALEQATTNTQVVSLESIADLAAPVLRRQGVHISRLGVHNAVAVQQAGQSDVVDVIATMPTAKQSALVANAYANAVVDFQRNSARANVQRAIVLVQEQMSRLPASSPRSKELAHDAAQLGVLEALQTGNASVVQSAFPPAAPSGPLKKRSAILGALLGALLGIALIMVLERLDRRLREIHEIQEIFGKPVLAVVPMTNEIARGGGVDGEWSGLLEPFRMLRANLAYFRVGKDRKSLIVTSSTPGDGKTTVATNLAVAAAISGQRVLLMEADLRRPSLDRKLRISASRGLSEVLSGQAEFSDVVLAHVVRETVGSAEAILEVLVAGATPPNPAELIQGDEMTGLLDQLKRQYDLIVIDTPPVNVVSDALLLLNRVDGVVPVVRLNSTMREAAIRLSEQFTTIGVDPLGLVVNAVPGRGNSYYYGGSYSRPSGDKSWGAVQVSTPSDEGPRRTEEVDVGGDSLLGGAEDGGEAAPSEPAAPSASIQKLSSNSSSTTVMTQSGTDGSAGRYGSERANGKQAGVEGGDRGRLNHWIRQVAVDGGRLDHWLRQAATSRHSRQARRRARRHRND